MVTPGDNDGGGVGLRPGTLDDGFNIVAKDLDRAFSLGLTTNQAVIMNSVREQSWSASLIARTKGAPRPQPLPVQLNLTRLAEGSGLNRSRLSTALKGLVAGRILTHAADGHLINKDYSKWLDDDGEAPRFTSTQLAYIRAAKRPKKAGRLSAQDAPAAPEVTTEIDTQLPLQNATVRSGPIRDIQNKLPLQNATVTVAKRNSEPEVPLQNATVTVADCNGYCCETQQRHIEDRACGDFKTLEINERYAQPGEPHPAPSLRSPDELRDVQEAISILGSYLNTEHLALALGRVHNTPSNIRIKGWRWIVAAFRITAREDVAELGFQYLRTMAINAGPGSLAKVRAEMAPAPDHSDASPAATCAGSGRKPTQAEKRKAENEAMRLAISQLPDEDF